MPQDSGRGWGNDLLVQDNDSAGKLAAIRDDDPTVICEDRAALGFCAHVPEEEYLIPYGVADIKREGTGATVVAIGDNAGREAARWPVRLCCPAGHSRRQQQRWRSSRGGELP